MYGRMVLPKQMRSNTMKKNIKIYPHNKQAFKNVLEAFKETNRTCVIHPTGSGKMFIALQLMDKFKDKHIAYITSYISIIDKLYNDMEKTGVKVDNLYTQIYGYLEPISGLDYIILDEFHHAGAPVWGAKLQELLTANPNAKVLGLSATPIRYLDDNRDMADELFNGNIASYMSLEEAIAEGIIKLPKYINAMYNFDSVIKTYEARITKIKNTKEQDKAHKLLEKAKRMLEQSEGMPEIMEKYIINKNGRYIVFCKDFEHLDLMTKECASWMRKVNKNINIYIIKSTIDKDINRNSLHDFEHNTDDSLKLLFCVDMLNEGIHVRNDGCIMLRPTQSYNVYLQQIGRVLAVSNNEATIFDIVNNSENLDMVSEFKENIRDIIVEYSNKDSYIDNFEIVENLRNFIEITNIIDNIIYDNIGWYTNYTLAKDYYKEHGNLLIPRRYIINGRKLGSWIQTQREKYKDSTLSEEKIKLLEDINMVWDVNYADWKSYYILAKKYYEEHGNLLIPVIYNMNGRNLGRWIRTQRKNYKDSILSEEKIKLLEDIGMIWNVFDNKWVIYYTLAKDYYKEHGNLLIPQRYIINGRNLGNWIGKQREYYNKSILSEEKIKLLEDINMIWDVKDLFWYTNYTLAKDYYKEHGNLLIPQHYIINGKNLGLWISNQRAYYKNSKLSQERIELLNSIGMVWNAKSK